MKNNLWVLSPSNPPRNSKDKSTSRSIKPELITLNKTNFYRISGNHKINTDGEQPLILFKKKIGKISHSFEYKMSKKNYENNILISDGGLKLKNQKYKTKYNYVYTKPSNEQFQEEIKTILSKYAIVYDKSATKNVTINSKNEGNVDENIYYRTVKGSSNRPMIKKKFHNNKSHEIHKDKIKIKKNLKKFEESKQNDENKDDLKKNLINGGKKNIDLLLKLIKKKKLLKNKTVEKKKEFLQKNGIGVSDVNLDDNEEEKKQPEKDDIKKMNKTANHFHRKINNYLKNNPGISSEKRNISITLENEDNNKIKDHQYKKPFKPIVDQFEFIKKINEEQKIIHTQESTSKRKNQKDKILLTIKQKNINKLNDSFRHRTHNNNSKKEIKSKSKEKEGLSQKKKKELPSSLIDVLNDEWPYSHKRSYRSPKELNKFKKEKRVLKREKANIEELEKNTKLFHRFKNLANLNYKKDIKYNLNNKDKDKNKIIEKIPISKSIDINKTSRSSNVRRHHFPSKKGKEPNEYYLGNTSKMNNSNSTLIEINKYYLNVLESQKLLVDSGFHKKNFNEEAKDISDNEGGNERDSPIHSKDKNKFFKKKNLNKNENKSARNKDVKINNFIKNKDKVNNKKSKITKKIVNPKNVFKLVEIIKFIIQRKVYVILYKYYIDLAIYQHYSIAFSYFIAICKNYPFRKIIAYGGYKSCDLVIKRLFLPFIRRNFRYFIGQLYFKRKLRYFIFILTKFFKFKALEKIYNSSQIEGNEEKYFKSVIFKIMKTLFKPHLKEAFIKIKNNSSLKKNNKNNNNNNRYKEQEEEYIKNKEDKKIKKDNINDSKSSENSEKYKKIAKRYLDYSPTYKKARSYLYESFSEDSSFSIRPNSLDNHQWAKFQAKIQLARYRIMNSEFENEEIEDDNEEYDKPYDNISSKNSEYIKEKKLEKNLKDNKKKVKEKKNENSDESSISINEDLLQNIKSINNNSNEKKDKKDIIKENNKDEKKKNDLINDKSSEEENNKETFLEVNNKEKKNIKEIKKDENRNNLVKTKTLSDEDISAERDENSIEWEYNLENKNKNLNDKKKLEDKKEKNINKNDNLIEKQEKEQNNKKQDLNTKNENKENDEKNEKNVENKKKLKKNKSPKNNEEEDYLGEFENINFEIKSESEQESAKKKENVQIKEEEKEPIKNENKKEELKPKEENKDKDKKETKINPKDFNKIKNLDKFSNELTEEIIKKILSSEITSQETKLIPYKSFKNDLFPNLSSSQSNSATGSGAGLNINKELGLLGLGQLSLTDDLSSLNDSIMSSYSAFSVFNRTIKDKKKENSLNLYFKKIAPRLIKIIKEEIISKYPRIYANISTPLKNKSVGLMMSLCLQDADMLRDNYKCTEMKESIRSIIDKEGILKKFEPINRQIRSKDKVTSDNFYDNMLNDCLIDTTIELINKERLYGENGDPLEWSSRTHELIFRYNKSDAKLFARNICKNLIKTMFTRVGLITENYDYLNAEQINDKRDKRLIDNIKNELDEDEYQWRNLEMEETQLKVEIAELIMEQLYNENIEILEHIQYSRNRPDLYLNKSIYACEEIPKLSFQQTTTENAVKDKDENDEVNMN